MPFSINITQFLHADCANELIVCVWDPTDKGCQERGKQSLRPFGAFYTAVTGILQPVWLEPIPENHIKRLKMTPDIDSKELHLQVKSTELGVNEKIHVEIYDNDTKIISVEGDYDFTIKLDNMKLWTIETPFLYDLVVFITKEGIEIDKVQSYFGMRKISIIQDQKDIPRIQLNNKTMFQYGVLDQGYWPDGLYTAPTDEALKSDIETLKNLGFNFIRKHVKIEPARWYYHCDKLGILVWQDMPNGGISNLLTDRFLSRGRRKKTVRGQFKKELSEMIEYLYNYPSVIVWIPFNEGWGQFETEEIIQQIRRQDKSRLIDAASGWFDKKVGDIKDIHKYPGPMIPTLEKTRVAVLGEFGGLGLKVDGHFWTNKKLYWSYSKSHTKRELREKYLGLLKKLKPMIRNGLAAAVYTQATDIEGEINGLLTYDREILKIESNLLKSVHAELISYI